MKTDVLIVGAGLSGIGAAYRIQTQCPHLDYKVVESRKSLGGTWDLFRYPGIRSDSDMYTLGYSFRPWRDPKAIADGPAILKYIRETAQEFGIDKHIHYDSKVVKANWESKEKKWQVFLSNGNEVQCKFLLMCAGYYDYDSGFTPNYKNKEIFKGRFIHPQCWDESLDYSDKKIIVIGSGATAVTLVPALAEKAKHVTMLQRSPSYMLSLPAIDSIAEKIKRLLPEKTAHKVNRWKNMLLATFFYNYCRRFPESAKKYLLGLVQRNFKDDPNIIENFKPTYNPWDQRLCFVPDRDFFKALKKGKADIVTNTIESFVENGIKLKDHQVLEADIIVSATGLNLKFLSGLDLNVDGQKVTVKDVTPYKSTMLSGVPNFAMIFGYLNNSWTLKCDLITDYLAKTLNFMKKNNYQVVRPIADPKIDKEKLVDFSSGYFKRAKNQLPDHGLKNPWRMNQSYLKDYMLYKFRPIDDEGISFEK